MLPVSNVSNTATTQARKAIDLLWMAQIYGGNGEGCSFAQFHRPAFACGENYDWEHNRNVMGETNVRSCERKNLGHGYIS